MTDTKTPVMLLQEYTTRFKHSTPHYEDLPEEVLDANKKVFSVRVTAVEKCAIGKGLNKKNAKHAAAAEILKKLGMTINYVSDLEAGSDEKQSPVTTLLDLCIQRKIPLAEFNEIAASGPSHCPEFTFECRVASMVKVAKANSKSKAKARAASMMLEILQEMQMNKLDELKIVDIKDAIEIEEEAEVDVIRTYRDYKKLDKKGPIGVRLCDRHYFWVSNFDQMKVEAAQKILLDENETEAERINLAMRSLNIKFEVEDVSSYGEKLKAFNLSHNDYECFFVKPEKTFWSDLLEYFKIMFNIQIYQ